MLEVIFPPPTLSIIFNVPFTVMNGFAVVVIVFPFKSNVTVFPDGIVAFVLSVMFAFKLIVFPLVAHFPIAAFNVIA